MRTPTEHGPDADEDLPEDVLVAIREGLTPLEAVRLWKRLTVEQLSNLSGISRETIHAAEGGVELSPEAQVKLAFVLGVRADLFYG